MKGHRVWAEVDLGLLKSNIISLRNKLPTKCGILSVIKSDAYGHGATAIANASLQAGCKYLGVGDSSEALELRENGVVAPILVLGSIIEDELPQVILNKVELSFHSTDLLAKINEEAKKQFCTVNLHLKIDTGLHRFGISPQNAARAVDEITKYPNLKLKGIFSHFSSVYTNSETTKDELTLFLNTISDLKRKFKLNKIIYHIANSGGVLSFEDSHLDMVRCGGALYGLVKTDEFKQILGLKTQIVYLKKIYAGHPIGYNGTYKGNRDLIIAICPVGYTDGIPTCYSNSFETIVNKTKAKIVGQVTMDYISIDVTDVRDAKVGDEVTIYDRWDNKIIDIAEKFRLNRYDLTSKLGRRIKRIYQDYEGTAYKTYMESFQNGRGNDKKAGRKIASSGPGADRGA